MLSPQYSNHQHKWLGFEEPERLQISYIYNLFINVLIVPVTEIFASERHAQYIWEMCSMENVLFKTV